jgi:hypothetical protein
MTQCVQICANHAAAEPPAAKTSLRDTATLTNRRRGEKCGLDQLAGVAATAQEVEASLRRVVGWITWRLLGRVGTVAAGCLLVVVLGNVAIGWWDGRAITANQAQKALLAAQIVGLQDTHDQLVQFGGRAVITKCGPSARLCIQVDGAAPAYADGLKSYRIIEGY